MRIMKLLMCAAIALMVAVSCSQKEEAHKVLVLYYSQTTHTKTVAQEIATRLGADIEEIALVEPYDGEFKETIERCMKERKEGVTPELKPLTVNIADYDVIFIGYPIWFGTYAPPIAALLDTVDLSGKKVVPFCTFGSGGLEASVKDMAQKQPKAEILPGYGVRAARLDAVPKEVEQFLTVGGFIEGAYVLPEDFPEQHPVSADESAIFDAAVDGYPMINAKATMVASRAIPEGTEYLFTAKDVLPRKAKHDELPSEIKVYVTVEQGDTPVFTKVVR